MSSISFANVAGVVIHHNRPDVLGSTVSGLIQEGVVPENIVVVDNSDADFINGLRVSIDQDVVVKRIPNKGYGNAVNYGLDLVLDRLERPEFVVVVTHEVSLSPGALKGLVEALEAESRLAAVGPVLTSMQEGGKTWTASGGTQTRFFGIPVHDKSVSFGRKDVVERAWLDGAVVLYRAAALEQRRMREDFFLYVEETEFHFRLAREVGPVACVSKSMASEEANEVPPWLLGRNLQWLFDLHGNFFQRRFSVPFVILRNAGKALLGRQTWSGVRDLWLGWSEARSYPARAGSDRDVWAL